MVEALHLSSIEVQERLSEVEAETATPITRIASHWLYQDELRMDARHYSTDASRALLIIERFPGEIRKLSETATECFILGRFKRVYATSVQAGWPYLSPSEVLQFRPTSERWIARKYAPTRPERHFAKQGWILVSASGTVGRPVLVTRHLEQFFLSHDLLRIVPSEEVPSGYLYAYISSWVGQALLTKDQYGSAIKHLEPHHVASIPVPLLPEEEMNEIADGIQKAYYLREEANSLLDDAMEELYGELGLPMFDEHLVEYLPRPETVSELQVDTGRLRAFTVRASVLKERFDASHHIPLAKSAITVMESASYSLAELSRMCEDIFLPGRFKRIYVSEEHGVPFIQSSHIPLMKPYDLKYIARRDEHNLNQCKVGSNWVLITRSGTIGRIGIVASMTDKQAVSEHCIRIIAKRPDYNPGYIALFLMTPYGQHQILSKIYGAVVDELTVNDLESVLIPDAPRSIQDAIGNKVLEAFEQKEQANVLENNAIRTLEGKLESNQSLRSNG